LHRQGTIEMEGEDDNKYDSLELEIVQGNKIEAENNTVQIRLGVDAYFQGQ